MEKIKRLNLKPIFEGKAIYEEVGSQILAVSIGVNVDLQKAEGASAILIESSPAGAVRYNKVEDKDLELAVLQNELAGLIGNFDSSVHDLLAKYGYKWQNPAESDQSTATVSNESINEAAGQNPAGTWVGDFFISETISISKVVDELVGQLYDFGDDQKAENKARSIIGKLVKESDTITEALTDVTNDNVVSVLSQIALNFYEEFASDLAEFEDHKAF